METRKLILTLINNLNRELNLLHSTKHKNLYTIQIQLRGQRKISLLKCRYTEVSCQPYINDTIPQKNELLKILVPYSVNKSIELNKYTL